MELITQQADATQSRRRSGEAAPRRTNRSVSNHSTSTTSSDILVAPGPIPGKSNSIAAAAPAAPMDRGKVTAEMAGKRLLIVTVTGSKNLAFLQLLAEQDVLNRNKTLDANLSKITTALDSLIKEEITDEGPNHRGTYSKAYVLQHPEIKWQHRGQGRYLPAPKGGRPQFNLIRSQS